MLSLPTFKQDAANPEDAAAADDENPPDPLEFMGVVEQKLSTIIYGNGNPLNPSPGS